MMLYAYFMCFVFGFPMMLFSWFLLFSPDMFAKEFDRKWYNRLWDCIQLTIPYVVFPIVIYGGYVIASTTYWSTAVLAIIGLFVFHGVLTYMLVSPHLQK